MSRRAFLGQCILLACAPAIVSASSLMPVRVTESMLMSRLQRVTFLRSIASNLIYPTTAPVTAPVDTWGYTFGELWLDKSGLDYLKAYRDAPTRTDWCLRGLREHEYFKDLLIR